MFIVQTPHKAFVVLEKRREMSENQWKFQIVIAVNNISPFFYFIVSPRLAG